MIVRENDRRLAERRYHEDRRKRHLEAARNYCEQRSFHDRRTGERRMSDNEMVAKWIDKFTELRREKIGV